MPLSTANSLIAQAREKARPRKEHKPPPTRPLPQNTVDHGHRYSLAQRIQALTLISEGFSTQFVEAKTGMKQRTQSDLKKKAIARGYDPVVDPRINEWYVQDGNKKGRPVEITDEVEDELLTNVRKDRSGREKSSEVLAYEAGISSSSALRVLHKHHLNCVKPTRKPGLNGAQKAKRLEFCLSHAHWSLKDWKRVIWSDETSVILGQRRGQVRIWRTANEAYDKTAIRNRWKGFAEFMFWGCFSWDKRGPCHIWKPETAADKKTAEKEIQEMNDKLEPDLRASWELETAMRRVQLRRRPGGRVPQWSFTKANGKLIRDGKGGIDWYRHWKVSCFSPHFSLVSPANCEV